MSSDLETRFAAAAQSAQSLPTKPDNATLLQLYSLYKQATAGDVTGKRPGMTDFRGRTKYDAWAALQGTSKDKAMQSYIALVEQLKKG